ncbi:MAG TPA: hypothetical protein VMR41_04900 [Patescibacteria group bacterium]|nr:hypothetical protein [Patescibacteria group bacterium]
MSRPEDDFIEPEGEIPFSIARLRMAIQKYEAENYEEGSFRRNFLARRAALAKAFGIKGTVYGQMLELYGRADWQPDEMRTANIVADRLSAGKDLTIDLKKVDRLSHPPARLSPERVRAFAKLQQVARGNEVQQILQNEGIKDAGIVVDSQLPPSKAQMEQAGLYFIGSSSPEALDHAVVKLNDYFGEEWTRGSMFVPVNLDLPKLTPELDMEKKDMPDFFLNLTNIAYVLTGDLLVTKDYTWFTSFKQNTIQQINEEPLYAAVINRQFDQIALDRRHDLEKARTPKRTVFQNRRGKYNYPLTSIERR